MAFNKDDAIKRDDHEAKAEPITQGELQHYIDNYYGLLYAIRDLPEVPDPIVLKSLGSIGAFPDDYNEGKRIQRERGTKVVPPVTECEIGAGFWHRVIKPVPSLESMSPEKLL